MTGSKDYLAMAKVEPGDKLDYGVKGMKWGIHRTPAQLGKDSVSKDSGTDGGDTKKIPSSGSEAAPDRYARLKATAKAGKAGDLSEQDLKWFNARTEALAKINKLNEQKPGWLKSATKSVLQEAAKKTMQQITDHSVNQYITTPINQSITKAAAKTAAERAAKEAAKKALKK